MPATEPNLLHVASALFGLLFFEERVIHDIHLI